MSESSRDARHLALTQVGTAGQARIAAGSIKPGALLAGEELAQLAPPLSVDNMEGVAARRGDNGETLLYVVSESPTVLVGLWFEIRSPNGSCPRGIVSASERPQKERKWNFFGDSDSGGADGSEGGTDGG